MRLEERSDREETVERLESTCVLWSIDESADECDDGGGLNGWTVYRFEKVQQVLGLYVSRLNMHQRKRFDLRSCTILWRTALAKVGEATTCPESDPESG